MPCPSAVQDVVDEPAGMREEKMYIYIYIQVPNSYTRDYILGALTSSDAPPPLVVIDSFLAESQFNQTVVFVSAYMYTHVYIIYIYMNRNQTSILDHTRIGSKRLHRFRHWRLRHRQVVRAYNQMAAVPVKSYMD